MFQAWFIIVCFVFPAKSDSENILCDDRIQPLQIFRFEIVLSQMQNIDQFANDKNFLREDVMEQLFFGFSLESVVFFGPLKMIVNLLFN